MPRNKKKERREGLLDPVVCATVKCFTLIVNLFTNVKKRRNEHRSQWKYHFQPSIELANYFINNSERINFVDTFYDTPRLDLARQNIFIVKREVITTGSTRVTFKVNHVQSFNEEEQQLIYHSYPDLSSFEGALSFLNKQFPNRSFTMTNIAERCRMVIQRAISTSDTANLTLVYDEIEYDNGDSYSLCTATSKEPCSEKEFEDRLAQLINNPNPTPTRTRYSEWLARYYPEFLQELAGNFSTQEPKFEKLPDIFESRHPESFRVQRLEALGITPKEMEELETRWQREMIEIAEMMNTQQL